MLILASQSPRRRQLLEEAGYTFEVIPPHETAECGVCSQETPPEMAARLAYQKAEDVARKIPRGIILGCDTIVECNGVVMGKPADESHARQMLERMSGREHTVFSGLCLWRRPDDAVHVRVDLTKLRMDELSADQLNEYLASGAWEGKAGAFGYQDRHGWLHLLEGSETNVVGLPMEMLEEMLSEISRDDS